MLWIWFVLPLVARRLPPWVALPVDVGAVGLYVFLAAIDLDGMVWFRGLVLPILISAVVILLVLCFLLRDHRHKMLTTATFIICGAAGDRAPCARPAGGSPAQISYVKI